MTRLISSRSGWFRALLGLFAGAIFIGFSLGSDDDPKKPARDAGKGGEKVVQEPKQTGGEPDGIVQVANLIYAGTKSSQCFADHFLVKAEKESSISTSRRFHAVKLGSEELYNFPMVIMTGEGAFELTSREQQNLVRYVQRGGFLLA